MRQSPSISARAQVGAGCQHRRMDSGPSPEPRPRGVPRGFPNGPVRAALAMMVAVHVVG